MGRSVACSATARVIRVDLTTSGVTGASSVAAPRWRRFVGVAALLVVLLGVPAVVGRLSADAPVRRAATAAQIYSLPTRGSLAGDHVFLQQISAVANRPNQPQLTAPRVVWAGDEAGARYALVVGRSPGGAVLVGEWYIGQQGATGEQMQLRLIEEINPTRPAALLDPDTSTLIVVAAPRDQVAVSDRLLVAADASIWRSYVPVPTEAGVAVRRLTAPLNPSRPGARIRVNRGNVVVADAELARTIRPERPVEPGPVPVTWARAGVSPTAEQAGQARALTQDVAGTFGLPRPQAATRIVLASDIDRPGGGGTTSFVVAAVRLPGGMWVVHSTHRFPVGGSSTDPSADVETPGCPDRIVPSSRPLDTVVLAGLCVLPGPKIGQLSNRLLIIGPPAASSATVLTALGTAASDVPLTAGVALVPLVSGATSVRIASAEGKQLTAPIVTSSDTTDPAAPRGGLN